ncbi:hydrolase [Streptomyces sp. NPDC049954]|uniref:hydrolase n=1 Tax=Streptomyces sp. NPDC049954 TaxID=3155779 RepID=UPI00341B9529
MTATTLDPATALVVIDLQNALLSVPGSPHTVAEVVDRSAELAEAFRRRGLPVVLVRVAFAADGADATPGRSETGSRHTVRPEGYELIAEQLAGHPEDVVVTKRSWGAFYGTDLDLQLRRRGVTQIVLTGVATSAGVESTARAAHEHGYHLTLVTDAMTDRDPDNHRHSVEKIFPRIGERGTTAEVLGLLATTHPERTGTGRTGAGQS